MFTHCIILSKDNTQRKNNLSPYEILFGSVPKTGLYFPQQMQAQFADLTGYVAALNKQLIKTHEIVFSSIPDPNSDPGAHTINPGDWVVVKKHVRKGLEPRYEGPFQVQLVTHTAVKLQSKDSWIHASHCKKVTEPAE